MNRLLKVDDVFAFKKEVKLKGRIEYDSKGRPYADLSLLSVGGEDMVNVPYTESKPGGWTRTSVKSISLSAPNSQKWRVLHTQMSGGGTGHGPGDVYPNGHDVVAVNIKDPGQVVRFYQTGCFIGMVDPKRIDLITKKEAKRDTN